MTEEKGRVWILEDSALEAEMARRALSASQDVSLFDDGSVLLERIMTGSRPNVLVLDSELVGVSGLEVCRVIRETIGPMELPILMLTVQSAKQDVVQALQAGANDYVTKPYHIAELIARVGNLVNASRLVAMQASRTRQLALGADVGVALNEGRGLVDSARRAAEQIATHFGALAVEVWAQRDASTGGVFHPIATIRNREDVTISPKLIERVRQSSAFASNGDLEADPNHSAVAAPLVVRGEVFGVLGLATREPISEAQTSLTPVANLLALGLARARAEEDRTLLLDRERNARGEAQAANRSKDDFLAMVSHELRTPLNAITGWTSMLLAGGLDAARTRRAYETIDRNARAQAQLIDDLLDIGRITSGQLRLNESTVDVASVAEMALESVRLTADSRGIELDSRIDASAGTIHGDAARVQQVIWNLLSNAIKFTPKGGHVSLSVTRHSVGASGESIIIEVKDTGQGITSDFLPRVFERFKQADNSATRARGGLGIGLAIVRHLVELHGGTIEAKSDGLGTGSTFIVSLPTRRGRSDDELLAAGGMPINQRLNSPISLSPGAPLDRPREIEGLRVLVVDDEPDARELLRTLLESCKVEVMTASSAQQALEVVKRSNVDVVLSDVAMPEEDGLSFIRRVRLLSREEGGRVPAVALTAYARLEDRTRALRAGFNAHVAKPVEPNELLAVLSSLASSTR